jgi:outer membrane protein assembly factor BamD (BamD/ComL family)
MLLLLLALQADGWEYRGDAGFVHVETNQRKTPQEFYDLGVSLAKARQTDDALVVFALLIKHVPDRPLLERARFKRGETLWSGSRFLQAYQELDDFLRLYPESELAQRAKELVMDSALLLAQEGVTSSFLGFLPILKSSKEGVEMLRSALLRFPREPFSSTYYYRLAEFLVEDEKYEEAENELKFILAEHKDTLEAPRAILLLGDIGLLKFDDIDYDTRSLQDARRNFERFVEEAPQLSLISREAAAFVKAKLPYAKEKIGYLNETEAEKEWNTAEYYFGKKKYRSAKVYYDSILKNYPLTTWAAKAKERLKEIK